jgi:hypothetical protein
MEVGLFSGSLHLDPKGLGSDSSTGGGQSVPQDRSDEGQKEAGDDYDQESQESGSGITQKGAYDGSEASKSGGSTQNAGYTTSMFSDTPPKRARMRSSDASGPTPSKGPASPPLPLAQERREVEETTGGLLLQPPVGFKRRGRPPKEGERLTVDKDQVGCVQPPAVFKRRGRRPKQMTGKRGRPRKT